MSNSKNSIATLIVLAGLLVVVLSYYLGVNRLNNMTEEVKNNNRSLKAQADAYESLYIQSPNYIKEMAEFSSNKEGLVDGFIYGLSATDKIMYITNLENKNSGGQLLINYFNMGSYSSENVEPTNVNNPLLVAAGIPTPAINDDGVRLYTYPLDFGFTVTYDGFKDMVKYLNRVGGYKRIESLTLSFDSSTGMLSGALSFNQYVLTGTGKEYEPISIPYVPTSLENVFGTVDVVPEQVEPSAE